MNVISVKAIKENKVSVKQQTLISLCAICVAVVLPQLFHVMGVISGVGSSLGELILPMHFPVIFVGLFAGPLAGALAGMFSPIVSFYLTGMPSLVLLPFMVVELFAYGLSAGFLRNTKISEVLKVFLVQLAGRAIRAVVILSAVHIFNCSAINPAIILTSISKGIFGIALQLVFIPLVLYRIKSYE